MACLRCCCFLRHSSGSGDLQASLRYKGVEGEKMLSECAPPTVVSLSVTFSDGVRERWVAGREGCPASNSSPAGAASPHHLPVHKGGLWVVVRCQPLRIHKGLPLQWKLLHQCQLSAAGASLVPYAASGVCACVNRGSYPARRIHAEGFGTGCCQSPPRSVPRRSRIRPFQIRVSFFPSILPEYLFTCLPFYAILL